MGVKFRGWVGKCNEGWVEGREGSRNLDGGWREVGRKEVGRGHQTTLGLLPPPGRLACFVKGSPPDKVRCVS
jgi:hypothetical protein